MIACLSICAQAVDRNSGFAFADLSDNETQVMTDINQTNVMTCLSGEREHCAQHYVSI